MCNPNYKGILFLIEETLEDISEYQFMYLPADTWYAF